MNIFLKRVGSIAIYLRPLIILAKFCLPVNLKMGKIKKKGYGKNKPQFFGNIFLPPLDLLIEKYGFRPSQFFF